MCDGSGKCEGTDVCMTKTSPPTAVRCLPDQFGPGSCKAQGHCDPSTAAANGGVGQCVFTFKPVGASCDDGEWMMVNDKCVAVPGGLPGETKCEGENLCAGKQCPPVDACHGPGMCDVFTGLCSKGDPLSPDGDAGTNGLLKCDDGDPNTSPVLAGMSDTCVFDPATNDVTCKGIDLCEGVDCGAAPQSNCHKLGVCNFLTGKCVHEPLPDNTDCDDSNDLTVQDRCDGTGKCVGKDNCINEKVMVAGVETVVRKDKDTTLTPGQRDCSEVPQGDGAVAGCRIKGFCEPATGKCNFEMPGPEYNRPAGTKCDDKDISTALDKCVVDPTTKIATCKGEVPCKDDPAFDTATGCGMDTWVTNGFLSSANHKKCNVPFCDRDKNKCSIKAKDPSTGAGAGCDDGIPETSNDACGAEERTVTIAGHPLNGVKLQVGTCVGQDLCEWFDPPGPPNGAKRAQSGKDCTPGSQCYTNNGCDNGVCKPFTPKNAGTPCDDKNERTENDQCISVASATGVTPPTKMECQGTDLCQTADSDKNGKACSKVLSDDPNGACKKLGSPGPGPGSCKASTGDCVLVNANEGKECDDGDTKTVFDTCKNGKCEGVDLCKGVTCSAFSGCHEPGQCKPQTGICDHPPSQKGKSCDDLEPKTTTDVCDGTGVCKGTNLCLDNTGSPKKCLPPAGAVGQCFAPGTCDYQTGTCSQPKKDKGSACDDSDKTTKDDVCDGNGGCKGTDKCEDPPGTPIVCADKGFCYQTGTCQPTTGICKWKGKTMLTPCDDGNNRTVEDGCRCEGNPDPPKGSNTPASPLNCFCKGTDKCKGVKCPAKNPCQKEGMCDIQTGACIDRFKDKGHPCDDRDDTTVQDQCDGDGVCVGVNLCENVVCKALDDCHNAGVCDFKDGQCNHPERPEGTACDDHDPTNVLDKCRKKGSDLICTGEAPCGGSKCETDNVCEVGFCDKATNKCSTRPGIMGLDCNDKDATTKDDVCVTEGGKGVCKGSKVFQRDVQRGPSKLLCEQRLRSHIRKVCPHPEAGRRRLR